MHFGLSDASFEPNADHLSSLGILQPQTPNSSSVVDENATRANANALSIRTYQCEADL